MAVISNICPFLYLVANLNGGNYNTAQGLAPWGAPVNWQDNFTDRQWRELNQLANNFNQWAANFAPGLIQTLMQFLTDVNQDPAAIQASQPAPPPAATSGDAFVQYLQQLDPAEYAAQFITDAGGDAGSGSDQYDELSWRSSMDRHDRSGVRRNLLTCADYGIVLPQDFNCSEIGDEDMCNGTLMYSEDNGKYKHCNWTNGACSSPSGPANIEGDLVYISDPDVACGTPFFNIRLPTSNCLNLDSDCNNFYSETSGINCCEYGTDENCSRGPGSEEGVCGESTGSTNIADDYQCFFSAEPSSEPDCSTFETQAGCLINRASCTWNPDDNTCTEGEDPLRRSLRETDPSDPPSVPDGSGCTNARATNYVPDATEDDGSCIIPGCTRPDAFNYDPEATEYDGTCIAKILGCTKESASNYNQQANTDDGSCKCGFTNLNSPMISKNLCGDIKDRESCENGYFTLKLPSKEENTYSCVWDEQGVSSGTSGGACSAYIGETTTYNQDNGGTPPTTEELSQLLNKCNIGYRTNSWYPTCYDYVTSLCNDQDNIQDCMESVCAGADPTIDQFPPASLVGTDNNFNVSPEMAQACGGGLSGRFGSRPNPDPGLDKIPYGSRSVARPGSQILNFQGVVSGMCKGLGIRQKPLWDNAPFTGKTANNQDFFDSPRRGAQGYYCNHSGITNQVSDCNSGFQDWSGAWTDEDDKGDLCRTRYSDDYYECEWEPGTFYGDCNKTSVPCAGEANSSTYDCPSYSNQYICNMYSDHCVWNPPTTRPENDEEMAASYGFNMPSGITRERTTINVPGSCTAK